MKVINVNALKEWIEDWFVKAVFYLPYNKSKNISIPELYDILERMPTVNAIPVDWIKAQLEKEEYRAFLVDYIEWSNCLRWLLEKWEKENGE